MSRRLLQQLPAVHLHISAHGRTRLPNSLMASSSQSQPFSSLQSAISNALVATTRTANRLASEDLAFYRNLDSKVAAKLDEQNERLKDLAERLLGNAVVGLDIAGPKFPDGKDDIDNKWRGVVDVIDSLLERADSSLDEFTGAVKKIEGSGLDLGSNPPQARPPRKPANAFRTGTVQVDKPQLLFDDIPTNDETAPWKPLLTRKPNAKKSLQDSLAGRVEGTLGTQEFEHPYKTEIEDYRWPDSVYTRSEPIPYKSYENTSAIFVDTEEAMHAMLEQLKKAKEIAVDLEHHDTRTYIGLTSLMQISTRDQDWVVDTLKPWRRKLECLNEVFTDPSIVKVLHGAFMDAVWLQRDLGIYLVGLFDTYHASRTLGYAGGSLAFLLQKFANFDAQKQYQMADWRIRPLPQELLDYARSDTHFLLYIYDNVRNDLVSQSDFNDPEKDKVRTVLEKSKEVALQRYEHPVYDAEGGKGQNGWLNLLKRSAVMLSRQQFAVFRAVHQWRDSVGRQEDESPQYVLAYHALFTIAREMPTELPSLLSMSAPISEVFRKRAEELLVVIAEAKESGANGPELSDFLTAAFAKPTQPTILRPVGSVTLDDSRPPTFDASRTRTKESSFWGNIFKNVFRRNVHTEVSSSDLSLAIPLPPLTAEVFADSAYGTPTAKPDHKFIKKADRPHETPEDEVFIIKQLGQRKRKQEEVASNADEILDPEIEAAALEKAQRKAERKAAKRAKKEAAASEDASAASLENSAAEPVPYDYANAPSVLHAQRNEAVEMRAKGKKREKPTHFDPFKQAMDAPKGLGKKNRESEGRSLTYRK